MYGHELALGEANWKARVFLFLLGADHWGDRIRANHLFGVLRRTIRPGHAVLDAGSGGGAQLLYLARRNPLSRFKGVELDARSVAQCNGICARLRGLSNAEFEAISLLDLTSVEEFDVVYSVDVLEHIEDDQRVLANLHSALKTGGTLVLHVPARGARAIDDIEERGKEIGHVRSGYTRDEIQGKLRAAGFQVVRVRSTFGALGAAARRLHYLAESQPDWFRWLAKLITFPICYFLGFGDTLLENRQNGEGLLVQALKA